jgi:hypothetical protein
MNYVILPSSELSTVDFSEVAETSESTLRYSLDNSKFILKYKGDQPSFLSGNTEYTKAEILPILATDEWTPSDPS